MSVSLSVVKTADWERLQRVAAAARTLLFVAHPSSELADRYIVHKNELAALRKALGGNP